MTKSSADLTPAGAPGANQNEINKLAQTIALKRDQNILDKTRAQLSGGSNVMTVFGKDHVETQLGSYESAFGKEPTPVAKCDSGIKSNSNMSSCSK